jgi:hypothetical protein
MGFMDVRQILEFLILLRLPARLDFRQTAELLGFKDYEIPILVRARLLKPLGNPAHNGHKYFAAVDVIALSQDSAWLDRASRVVARHWAGKAAKRRDSLKAA